MTNIARYKPSSLLHQLHRLSQEWDQLFEPHYSEDNSLVETSHWAPCVDIKEEASRFVLYADIPGVDPKNIEITMENGVLRIKGEHMSLREEKKENYTRIERSQRESCLRKKSRDRNRRLIGIMDISGDRGKDIDKPVDRMTMPGMLKMKNIF